MPQTSFKITGGKAVLKKGIVIKKVPKKSKSKLSTKMVQRIINRGLEKKESVFYGSYNDGSSPARAIGGYANRGWSAQNPKIDTNTTDIMQLIPYVQVGQDDYERIGKQITPKSLRVKGACRVWLPAIVSAEASASSYAPTNISVVLYVLQHVSLKDYPNLYASNDFTQMLSTGVGGTTNFVGEFVNSLMPVASQYYKVIKKKIIKLKYAGLWPRPFPTTAPVTPVGIPNSHQWFANYSINLDKALPAKLKFPEENAPAPLQNQPTNSSIFMCMGCYNEYELPNAQPFASIVFENTYFSKLKFTDA